MNKLKIQAAAVVAGLMLFAGVASAHVTVNPAEATAGSYQKFTVRVPTEKDVPTTKIEVKFPVDAVSVSRFEPKPGWKYEIAKDGADKITGVTWTAENGGLTKTEFGEFNMQGKVADNATSIVWKAYQTYQDGSVVEWTGAEGSDKPASVTKVTAKPAGGATDSHGHTSTAPGSATAAPAQQAGASASNTPLYLSIAAVVLSAASLLLSLFRKRA
ncbi:YcnI family protein [Paenibacillus chitinolyticus]|uniref:YcnI family copper-binding membrane protein n=1 Tax=Paenibacillus chitinolyticus TaxID=79263 RepID=UPI002DB91C57|nr:YcnI family protein [Paenibacillus chitinolyticus]MEC0249489.1 YcnI family protein [Paenibacillus chitinolyticus]